MERRGPTDCGAGLTVIRKARAGTPERSGYWARVVAVSVCMRNLLAMAERAAPSDLPIILQGETGTGKELLARGIHQASRRRSGTFVSLNCASLPESLVEAELFGHIAGAFTGALKSRQGILGAADGGTVLLDEIDETSLIFQAKLLQVLQSGEMRPVGGDSYRRVDVRFIAATKVPLAQSVREGRFREDLHYRLNGVTLNVPPLRRRKEDIPALVSHFVTLHSPTATRVSPSALQRLLAHDFPGNVRELEMVIRRAAALAESDEILPEDLGFEIDFSDTLAVSPVEPSGLAGGIDAPAWAAAKKSVARSVTAEIERGMIVTYLRETGGNVTQAASRAGMNRSHFHKVMARNGIQSREFRTG